MVEGVAAYAGDTLRNDNVAHLLTIEVEVISIAKGIGAADSTPLELDAAPCSQVGDVYSLQAGAILKSIGVHEGNGLRECDTGQAGAVAEGTVCHACCSLLNCQIAGGLVTFVADKLRPDVKETVGSFIILCIVPRGAVKREAANEGETGWKSKAGQTATFVKSTFANSNDRGWNGYRSELLAAFEQSGSYLRQSVRKLH